MRDVLEQLTEMLQGPMSAPFSVKCWLARLLSNLPTLTYSDAGLATELLLGQTPFAVQLGKTGTGDPLASRPFAECGPSLIGRSLKRDKTRLEMQDSILTKLQEAQKHCNIQVRGATST